MALAAAKPAPSDPEDDRAVREGQAVMTELDANASAITYWVKQSDGWHVVTTVASVIGRDADAEQHAVVRFSSVLLPGQSQLISVPFARPHDCSDDTERVVPSYEEKPSAPRTAPRLILIIAIAGPVGSRIVPIAREPSSFFTFVATRTYSSPAFTKSVAVPPFSFETSSTTSKRLFILVVPKYRAGTSLPATGSFPSILGAPNVAVVAFKAAMEALTGPRTSRHRQTCHAPHSLAIGVEVTTARRWP